MKNKEMIETLDLLQDNSKRRLDIAKLATIWSNPGRMPQHHYRQKERLAREWPMLYEWITNQLKSAQPTSDTPEAKNPTHSKSKYREK